ncbi:hypothetical protein KXV85_002262, partial [Aspergillus fumigatus]
DFISPAWLGLSHMGQDGEKEVVVPSGLEHFVAGANWARCSLQGIEGQLADGGEIFRCMVLSTAAGVLVEQDVEDPVQVVLDAPVGAYDIEQLLGRQQARSQKVSGRLLGRLAGIGAPAVDPPDSSDSGKAILLRQLRCRRDNGLPALDAAVSGGSSLACSRRPSSGVEQDLGGLEEPAAIALDGENVVALAVADSLRRVGPAMQGVGSDNGA